MNSHRIALHFLTTLVLSTSIAVIATAQDVSAHRAISLSSNEPPTALSTWNGKFNYQGKVYRYTMVGTNPASTNATTTVTTYLVPLKVQCGTTLFDPNHILPNGQTVVQNTSGSPVFQSGIDFVQGGVDLGNTQYIDAYQRGNFWASVQTNSNYHVLLGLKVQVPQSYTPPTCNIRNGRGVVDEKTFNAEIQSLITNLGFQSDSLPIFLTYNVVTQNASTGGFHFVTPGGVTYIYAAYLDQFDVQTLSHEVAEWMDDPFAANHTACGSAPNDNLLEVADPVDMAPYGENGSGGYSYVLNGFTYHLQDLVFLPYFGAMTSTSVNGWFTFQNEQISICQNGERLNPFRR